MSSSLVSSVEIGLQLIARLRLFSDQEIIQLWHQFNLLTPILAFMLILIKIRPTPTLWPIPLFGRTSFFSNLSWWPSLCTAGWQVVANESPVPSGTPLVATPATLATPLGGNPSHPPPPPWIPPEAAKIKHCSIISRVCHLWKQEKKTLSKMLNLFWSVVIQKFLSLFFYPFLLTWPTKLCPPPSSPSITEYNLYPYV